MAKLSTGQTYGTTSRVTSQRLLGGEAQIATGAPLAQAELGQPALQPQASPVNTFQQVGAPTLGGPLRMFEPPALPRPSQDLANLVDALSGFNKNLQQYSTSMEEVRLAKDQAAKEEGQAVGAQLQASGYMSIKEAIADIGKKVQTDPSLLPLYNTLQANNPARDRYINDTLSNLAIQGNLVSLPSYLENLKTLPSGRELKDVPNSDPEFRQVVYNFLYGSGTTPRALANNSVAVAQSSAAAGVAQQQRFVDAGNKKTIDTHWEGVAGLIYDYAKEKINGSEFSQKLSALETNLYNATSPENFKKYKEGALANLGNLLLVHQENARDKSKFKDSVLGVLGNTGSGPVKDNKQVESLLGSFGVPAATARFQLQKIMKQGLNAQRIEEDQAAEQATQDLMKIMLERFTPAVVSNPAKYNEAVIKLKKDMLLAFPDPRQLGTAQGLANSVLGGIQAAYVAPKQQQNLASEYEAAWVTDDIARGKTRIRNMLARNELSQEDYGEISRIYRERQSGQNKLNLEDVVSRSRQLEAKQKEAFGTTYFGDYKAGALSTDEQRQINQDRSKLKRKAMDIIDKSGGKDVSAEIEKLYATEMVKYDRTPAGPQSQAAPTGSGYTSPNAPGAAASPAASKPPAVQSPEKYMKLLEKEGFGKNWFGGLNQNTPQKVTALNKEIKNTKLYERSILIQQLDDLQKGKELDEPTKLIIKSSTMKPSEFFLNQLRNHGLTIEPGQEQNLKSLDKSNLVSAADTTQTMAYPGFAVVPQATSVQELIRQGLAKWNSGNRGTTPAAAATPTSNSNAGRKLRVAIIGKESGGNYDIVNPDFGAIGIGQVLPENVPSWTAKHYGQRLTPAEYRKNRAAQDAVVHGQLQDYYDAEIKAGRSEAIAIRRAASAWYSGQPNSYDNTKVQISGGRRYPSIREYTMDILRRYQRGN